MAVKKKVEKKKCISCGKELALTQFYTSSNPMFDGKTPMCKNCIKEKIDYDNKNSIYSILQSMDIPFLYDIWELCLEKNGDTFGNYIRRMNSLPQYRGMKWSHSSFESTKNIIDENEEKIERKSLSKEELSSLKDKFGEGYPDNEYFLFEKKYQELRPSFQLLTTMHEECLREYCINKVKEGLAKAKGDFKEAKEWAGMAKDVANSGKLNPSQMSKADLSGGLDTFGQMARMVEQTEAGELLNLLPKFVERPKDRVDITLWHYINYVRDLKGLEECEYKDIYAFYERRRAEYDNQALDLELTPGIEEGDVSDV